MGSTARFTISFVNPIPSLGSGTSTDHSDEPLRPISIPALQDMAGRSPSGILGITGDVESVSVSGTEGVAGDTETPMDVEQASTRPGDTAVAVDGANATVPGVPDLSTSSSGGSEAAAIREAVLEVNTLLAELDRKYAALQLMVATSNIPGIRIPERMLLFEPPTIQRVTRPPPGFGPPTDDTFSLIPALSGPPPPEASSTPEPSQPSEHALDVLSLAGFELPGARPEETTSSATDLMVGSGHGGARPKTPIPGATEQESESKSSTPSSTKRKDRSPSADGNVRDRSTSSRAPPLKSPRFVLKQLDLNRTRFGSPERPSASASSDASSRDSRQRVRQTPVPKPRSKPKTKPKIVEGPPFTVQGDPHALWQRTVKYRTYMHEHQTFKEHDNYARWYEQMMHQRFLLYDICGNTRTDKYDDETAAMYLDPLTMPPPLRPDGSVRIPPPEDVPKLVELDMGPCATLAKPPTPVKVTVTIPAVSTATSQPTPSEVEDVLMMDDAEMVLECSVPSGDEKALLDSPEVSRGASATKSPEQASATTADARSKSPPRTVQVVPTESPQTTAGRSASEGAPSGSGTSVRPTGDNQPPECYLRGSAQLAQARISDNSPLYRAPSGVLQPRILPSATRCLVPECGYRGDKLFRHSLSHHLPWFVKRDTACFSCRCNLQQRKFLERHMREEHGSDTCPSVENVRPRYLAHMKTFMLALCDRLGLPSSVEALYALFYQWQAQGLVILPDQLLLDQDDCRAFCTMMRVPAPDQDQPFVLAPISSPGCLIQWRVLLSLVAVLSEDTRVALCGVGAANQPARVRTLSAPSSSSIPPLMSLSLPDPSGESTHPKTLRDTTTTVSASAPSEGATSGSVTAHPQPPGGMSYAARAAPRDGYSGRAEYRSRSSSRGRAPRTYREKPRPTTPAVVAYSSSNYVTDSHFHLDKIANNAGIRPDDNGVYSFRAIRETCTLKPEQAATPLGAAISCTMINKSVKELHICDSPLVAYMVGVHPTHITDYRSSDIKGVIKALQTCLQHEKVVALGEVGLDFHWVTGELSQRLQYIVLEQILTEVYSSGRNWTLPIVLHVRDRDLRNTPASKLALELLTRYDPQRRLQVYRHYYTGSLEEANAWLREYPNAYFGVGPGALKLHNEQRCSRTFRSLSLDRLLVETDGGAASFYDQPHITPFHVHTVYRWLAAERGMALGEVIDQVAKNFATFYKVSVDRV